ncbi:hypothetical protein ACFWE3_11030 [Mycobacteriaceae bacterium NPDC060252]
MTRTDRRGRELKQFLQAEILRQDISIDDLYTACGLSKAQWYGVSSGTGRRSAEDFPNTEELRRVAERFELGDDGYLNLLVEFSWLEPRADAPGFSHGPVIAETKKSAKKRTRLRDSQVNPDAPPLH